jgi:1,2-phenylacetyl-CoA epoxidase PaaB subunit
MMSDRPNPTLWAAGLLAFRQKPIGGTEYQHTVALIYGVDSEAALQVASGEILRRFPVADGWTMHGVSLTSMADIAASPTASRSVMGEVLAERERADAMHGGPRHDDTHTLTEWADTITERVTRGEMELVGGRPVPGGTPAAREQAYRRRLIQAAGLCIAAVESFDRGAKLT